MLIEVLIENSDNVLRPGFFASAKVRLEDATAVAIPAAALHKQGDSRSVFVVENGKAQFHKVETGITGATDIEVLSGLKEGGQIITGSYQVIRTIRNETQVKVDNKSPVAQSKS